MDGDASLGAGCELVAQANVGKGSAHHDVVISTARAVGVEVGRDDPLALQVFSGGTFCSDGPGR